MTASGRRLAIRPPAWGETRAALGRAIVPVVAGVAIWWIPVPPGLAPKAWSYFALFVTVILALITEPIPGPVIGIIGVTAATALLLVAPTPTEAARWALSGFSHGTVWLIFVAFTFGLGYEKTGLGRRIALGLVRRLGGRTLGLGYATGPAPIFFGSGYIGRGAFWALGSIFGAIFLLVLLAVGVPYLLAVGG